jgi:energy-coupling factor transporter ATP-binding protein EcfA2
MPINRVEIKDFLVFEGEFAVDFCPGVNIIIGVNGTGKTTLIKALYALSVHYGIMYRLNEREFGKGKVSPNFPLGFDMDSYFTLGDSNNLVYDDFSFENANDPNHVCWVRHTKTHGEKSRIRLTCEDVDGGVYIPEKDMLSNSKGLPETVKYGKLQFTRCETEIIERARVAPSVPIQPLVEEIYRIINGEVENDGEAFFVKKRGMDERIPFSMEASGFRKLGLLATLIRNEQIKPGMTLFWDEPENSLHPKLIPMLIKTLLKLQKAGVQIFIATHDDYFCKWLDMLVTDDHDYEARFISLYQDDDKICGEFNASYRNLGHNEIIEQSIELYNEHMRRTVGDDED